MRFFISLALAATACNAYAVSESVAKRSPEEVDSQIKALALRGSEYLDDTRSLDTRSLETELGPPKCYNLTEIGELTHVNAANLDYSHPFISATTYAVTGALSFSSLVTGCIGVDSASPIASYSCAASLAATGISFLSSLYHAYRGVRNIRATLRNNNIEIGLRAVRRGLDAPSPLSLSHDEYMEHVLRSVGLNGTRVGLHRREGADFDTPVYQFSHADGNDYHLSISADDNGEVRHSVSFAGGAGIEKRQGYEAVRVIGGLDLEACQRKNGDQSDNPSSASSAYSYFYKDLTCLVSSTDLLGSNYLNADVMDKSGYTVLTIGMAPYAPGQANKAAERSACTDDPFYMSLSCIN